LANPFAPRAIAPFYAMEMAREAAGLAATGRSIVRFDVGQPQWGAPPAALAAAKAAMARDPLGYSDALGAAALRQALSDWYARTHRVEVPPGRIVITTGASGAFQLAFLALLADGDGAVMARPGYPPYRHILSALGFRAVEVDGAAEDGFQLTAALLERACDAHPRVAAAVLASPANPTGAILPAAALATLSQAAKARGVQLISDEIYHGLDPDGRAVTALRVEPDAIVINSFSKYWAMTGWRVGWLVAPERLIGPIERLAQNLTICPPAVSQAAALGALYADAWCAKRASVVAANRKAILAAAPALGLIPATPSDGAFYALLNISAYSSDSFGFCQRALAEAGVAMTPGIDFDPTRGKAWVRLAFARERAAVSDGLQRLGDWLAKANSDPME
jgi:aspartate/methionine/tyrosine aminotransferase